MPIQVADKILDKDIGKYLSFIPALIDIWLDQFICYKYGILTFIGNLIIDSLDNLELRHYLFSIIIT